MRKFGTNYGEMGLGKIMKNCARFEKLENGKTKFLLFLGSLPKRVGHSSPIHLFFVVEAFYNALQDLINARLD
jgi:hypothetical protein